MPWMIMTGSQSFSSVVRADAQWKIQAEQRPSKVLPSLVKNLICTVCGQCNLTIRAVDRELDMVSKLETFCTGGDQVINSTLSSDRIGSSYATNLLYVVVRSAVSASMDMQDCCYLDMPVMTANTFNKHMKAITAEGGE